MAQSPAAPLPIVTRLLVVDDNEDCAEFLAELLKLDGFEVRVALDGPSALAIAAAFEPQVCLLDIGLPHMDGYELARRLRGDGATRAVPIQFIAISGYGYAEDHARSSEAGFRAHLVKPIKFEEIAELLRSY